MIHGFQAMFFPGSAAAEQATSGSCAARGSGTGAATVAGSEAGRLLTCLGPWTSGDVTRDF